MAVDLDIDAMSAVVAAYLDKRLRYRCLVIQSKDMTILSRLCENAIVAAQSLGNDVAVLEASQQFDDIGALSCDALVAKLDSKASDHPVVVAGPLHFLDYWSERIRARFWRYFAAFSSGPGIVVTDSFRTDAILGPFQVVDGFARSDIRCLKSRLESTQDRLA